MMWDRCDQPSVTGGVSLSSSGFQPGKSGGFGRLPDPPWGPPAARRKVRKVEGMWLLVP